MVSIKELMNAKGYAHYGDVTLNELRELGECVNADMSLGALLEIAEILYEEAD